MDDESDSELKVLPEGLSRVKTQQDLLKFEATNLGFIVLRRSGVYWTGYERTAWFLDELYGIRNKEIKMRYDANLKRKVRSVVFHVDNFGKIREKLLEKCDAIVQKDTFLVLRLPKPVKEEEIKAWERRGEKVSDVEAALYPDRLSNRTLVRQFVALNAALMQTIRDDMPSEMRTVLGSEMLRTTQAALGHYVELEITCKTMEACAVQARSVVTELQKLAVLAMTAFSAGAMEEERAMRIGQMQQEVVRGLYNKYLRLEIVDAEK
ncbi:hypothetical protein FWH13_01090 [Candidatus Saccharibacteria bacterium]|nr:hypothetical protein [Candidatus Saccharibacteria bacterium]